MDQRAQARIDQALVALSTEPLDRIRLMKTIFLTWHRSGRPATGPFDFTPYLYGPCAFNLYSALNEMERRGLIVQPDKSYRNWASYYLTQRGQDEAKAAVARLDKREVELIRSIAQWARKMSFRGLLDAVYSEAPDYASESVLRTG
jgi:hypothetical protein